MNSAPSADASPKDLQALFAAQGVMALRLRQSTAAQRLAKINALHQSLQTHQDALIAAGAADFGKPAEEVMLGDILPVVVEIKLALRQLKGWMKPRKVWPTRLTLGTAAYTQHQPKGRVLIVAPWNYPVNLSLGPLVSALAAGNAVILKPSELTPHASAVIAKIVRAVFAPDEVAVLTGGANLVQALLAQPFDHIFFTGSPVVGKLVMAAASQHLCSVTLELGGKSPALVDETADLAAAARHIMWAKFSNNGQTCIAPDHVYVQASVKPAFVQHCIAVLKTAYGVDPASSPDLARMVNARHFARVVGLLDDAVARGAKVLVGGNSDAQPRFVAPTLIDAVPDDALIMQEEIFGPLLPLIAYTDLGAVIARINVAPKPLALYLWSRDQKRVEQVMQQTSSGGACINQTVVQFMHGHLPFGGVGNSGMGQAHGWHGFATFSHERAVLSQRWNPVRLLFPPYSGFKRRLMNWLLKLV